MKDMFNEMRIRAQREWYEDRVNLLLFQREGATGRPVRLVVAPLEVREVNDGECVNQPTISIGHDAAVELMDSLWEQGIRPTDKSYGSLQSVQDHLSDMRQIAFHKLGIK